MKPSFDDRLTTNCAKNYCNRTLVKVIVENVVTCFLGHGVCIKLWDWSKILAEVPKVIVMCPQLACL